MVTQSRSYGSSSQSCIIKARKGPFRRCYCGLEAPFQVSWSDKNPGRRYFGCRYFPDEDEDCGYFEWYDEDVSSWYKQVLNEIKLKKKPSTDPSHFPENANPNMVAEKVEKMVKIKTVEKENPTLLFLVRILIGLLVLFIVIVGVVLGLLLK